MPFDPATYTDPPLDTRTLPPGADWRTILTYLEAALRGPPPGNHRWDYCRLSDTTDPDCGTVGCAIGEACVLWGTRVWFTKMSGIPLTDYLAIFNYLHRALGSRMSAVTRRQVADAIKCYLATGKVTA